VVDTITCEECGETFENGPSGHDCPGSMVDRVADIENRVEALEEENEEFRRRVEALEKPPVEKVQRVVEAPKKGKR
jgi:hypothetical protein